MPSVAACDAFEEGCTVSSGVGANLLVHQGLAVHERVVQPYAVQQWGFAQSLIILHYS